jgi:GGDEF domain-containing protein
VTLLLFDIDNFKKYNDEFGHSHGDEILRETAAVMKRCVREHDLVARIGGDEFAVVFWDKEGPRQPKEPNKIPVSRPPQEPREIFDRFKRLIETRDFPGLGTSGQGQLTISGGLANYPWDGRNVRELIELADNELMFKAKKAGKNTILLVGRDEQGKPEQGKPSQPT